MLDEQVVAVPMDDTTLQTFKKTRFGYLATSLSENVSDWELVTVIPEENYHCMEKNNRVYLIVDS